MKLSQRISQLLHKKSEIKDVFLSLIVDVTSVQGAVWSFDEKKKPYVEFTVRENVQEDSWDERVKACDQILTNLEKQLSSDIKLTNVVLGLPSVYVTKDGDIHAHIRSEIRKLTKQLELHPIGFVPVPHALIHKFKIQEGVPPSVILLGLSGKVLSLDLYKVGTLIGQKVMQISGREAVRELEDALKSFRDLEVLPSRILLYGDDQAELEGIRQKLLKHPWPTRVNFLHFPKIEVFPHDDPITAVCMAGASEIATQMSEEPLVEDETHTVVQTANYIPSADPTHRVIAEEPNVVEVDPATLGFTKSAPRAIGVVEAEEDNEAEKEEEEEDEELLLSEESDGTSMPVSLNTSSAIESPAEVKREKRSEKRFFAMLSTWLSRFKKSVQFASAPGKRSLLLAVPVILVFSIVAVYRILPRADVTIVMLPMTLEESSTITINPIATIADPANNSIPAKKQEQSVSGEKTIPVTGKKQVGDPAKGMVTLYNQIFVPRVLAKGTVLTTGSLKFTLDDETKIASASQTLLGDQGDTKYGTAKASITSVQIGSLGNIPKDKLFDIAGFGKYEIIARNDAAFSGGTSKDVTVVSRADYDTLVTDLSRELVEKAKTQLAASVGDGERLIDLTVKTMVTEKKFIEELDQQANELHGNITVSVSGMSYQDGDIIALLQGALDAKVPSGYQLEKDHTEVLMGQITLKKDGAAAVSAKLKGQAIPILDIEKIKTMLAGKSIDQAKEVLRALQGVAGVEISFHRSFRKDTLPVRSQNITITKIVQQ